MSHRQRRESGQRSGGSPETAEERVWLARLDESTHRLPSVPLSHHRRGQKRSPEQRGRSRSLASERVVRPRPRFANPIEIARLLSDGPADRAFALSVMRSCRTTSRYGIGKGLAWASVLSPEEPDAPPTLAGRSVRRGQRMRVPAGALRRRRGGLSQACSRLPVDRAARAAAPALVEEAVQSSRRLEPAVLPQRDH